MKKTLWMMIALALCCSVFMACGKKEKENDLVGKWEAVEDEETVLVFNDDGTYMYITANGNNANGSYKVTDNEIQMTADASGLDTDLDRVSGLHEFTLDGKKLIFSKLGHAYTEYIKVE